MKLNPHKCKLVLYTLSKSTSPPESILIDNVPVNFYKEIKDLGVWFDSNLTFMKHSAIVNNKLRSLYGIFWRNYRRLNSLEVLRTLYFTYVQSTIDYCLPVWGKAAPTTLDPVVRTHKKFLKLLLNIHPYEHGHVYENLANEASIFPLNNRCLSGSAQWLAFRTVND